MLTLSLHVPSATEFIFINLFIFISVNRQKKTTKFLGQLLMQFTFHSKQIRY